MQARAEDSRRGKRPKIVILQDQKMQHIVPQLTRMLPALQIQDGRTLPRYHRPDSHQIFPPSSGVLAGGFGGVAGIFALFFFAEVPKVSKDIMQKVPILGSYFVKEIAPEDNPF
ncbi:hypothetical protein K504DRAFT_453948 [Pleomassaria siparia CBS 279.74]|uniref:Uncharacterized protein n=1 Tax=Pleomassaria siparia CBS 279.74 TaxID=1314801 RepID=A0A6G1KDF3_9PLEO|nr:hypothetical protein K504DRAFT_453948 [Pleomassaria siparia CBS 279.74]